MYDAIIVGARVAGSPTAMLLARRGYRVLLVDRATFPSDTLSTHLVQVAGGALLKRWGLLDRVLATGCPPAHRVSMDVGPFTLRGEIPALDGVDAVIGPRRILLDEILVRAADEAGAEVREGFAADEVLVEDGRVVGIRGRTRAGAPVTERARIVVGADGLHSRVARTVRPATYGQLPPLSCAYYTYYADVPTDGGEMYMRERRSIGAWPTNDGLTMIYTAWPAEEFHRYRSDIEGGFLATMDLAPALAERVRGGRRAGRFLGTADLPNFYRRPYGPGWALVGDSGYHKDPLTGLGISDAFRDADLLAGAVDAGLCGRQPMEAALAGYEASRNAASRIAYQTTTQLASFRPLPPEFSALQQALRHNQEATNQFFGVMSGSVPAERFFSPPNLLRIIGVGGMARVALQRVGMALRPAA